MKYPQEDNSKKPGKPKVWIITCQSLSRSKTGWKVNWEKTEKRDGWEDHFD